MAVDKANGYLYCIYHGFRDANQAQNGYYNAELYGMASTDGGATWVSNAPGDSGVNLTNTPASGLAGVYSVRMEGDNYSEGKKFILVR